MSFYTNIEIDVSVDTVKTLILETIKARREIQGYSFATADEAEGLASDPLANIYLVEGQLLAWAQLRYPSHRIKYIGNYISGRFVCLQYRVEADYIAHLAKLFLETHLPRFIAQSRSVTTKKALNTLRQDLTKAVCQSVKTALGLPSENRLGYTDEDAIKALVDACWSQASQTTWA